MVDNVRIHATPIITGDRITIEGQKQNWKFYDNPISILVARLFNRAVKVTFDGFADTYRGTETITKWVSRDSFANRADISDPRIEDIPGTLKNFIAHYKKKEAESYLKLAEKGDAAAQFELGVIAETGNEGIEQSYEEAVELYQKAANQGHAGALNNLGALYARGNGVVQDFTKAAELYKRAADKGFAVAKYNLGICFLLGRGVDKSEKKAFELLQPLAEQGNMNAQINIGNLYRDGRYVKQDFAKAAMYYEKAALQGNADAQYNLGQLWNQHKIDKGYVLMKGQLGMSHNDVPNDDHARFWLQKAAEQEHVEANYALGSYGGLTNVQYYTKAAKLGHVDAQYELGLLYAKGSRNLGEDAEKAQYWMHRAAEGGSKKAEQWLIQNPSNIQYLGKKWKGWDKS